MSRTTVFKNNKTQAIRLPKAVAFPEDVKQVDIIKQGNNLLVVPVRKNSWAEFFALPRMDDDFLKDRDQPSMQDRKWG